MFNRVSMGRKNSLLSVSLLIGEVGLGTPLGMRDNEMTLHWILSYTGLSHSNLRYVYECMPVWFWFPYGMCCGPILSGTKPAETAEADALTVHGLCG